uniref:Ubiquitin-like-conjugating enzyme ATG10 n=1 Tax=Lygus hesperus TaxID=30085 RepID=A0A146LX41_LYGHE
MSTEPLSWADFVVAAQDFLRISSRLNDGWEWLEAGERDGESYLRKKERQLAVDSNPGSLTSWEYHVLYSPSYSCPVLYFNVHDQNGRFFGLDRIVRMLEFPSEIGLDNYLGVVSQTEHPILRKPYCYLHPCRTGDLMATQSKRSNVLISWLSCVAPVVRLDMSLEYAKPT